MNCPHCGGQRKKFPKGEEISIEVWSGDIRKALIVDYCTDCRCQFGEARREYEVQ